MSCLLSAGYQAWFVGGCVRNALINAPVNDIDIASDALPETVMSLAGAAGFSVVATGIEHGTVTVISNGLPHEVTSFRRDVQTDGRRAVVAYAQTAEEDAHRRDFTINALYADATGRVYDPLGGLPDLKARRVRFIDDAGDRIREDYLRILRFFRFHAWYGDPAGGMDADALSAIAQLAPGVENLSRERVGAEMCKLLAAPDPLPALAAMAATGVLARVLPGADVTVLGPLVHLEDAHQQAPDAILRLAALGGSEVADRLRLSRADGRRLQILHAAASGTQGPGELGYRFGITEAMAIGIYRAALFQQPLAAGFEGDAGAGAAAVFPVRASDLMPALAGPALGARLRELEARWIASQFTMTRAALLA